MGFTNLPKQGPKFDYYNRFTVTSSTFGGDDGYYFDGYNPNVVIPFSSQGWMVLNEDGYAIVEISFDGVNVGDRIDPSIIKGVQYNNRVNSLMWFRLAQGTSAIVSIRAWGIR